MMGKADTSDASLVMMLHDGPRVGVVKFPHVLLEIKVAAETFAAQTASERLLVVVSVHVESQIVNLKREKRKRKWGKGKIRCWL